jgi:hypothetical protein
LTADNWSMESLPYMDQDAFALLIKPGVEKPFRLSDSLFMPNNIFRKTRMTINADNSVLVERSSTRTGGLAGHYRSLFRNKGKQETEKEIKSIIIDESNAVQLKDYEFKGLDSLEGTLFYRFSFVIPNGITEAGGLKIFKMDWADKFESNQALTYDQRTFPYAYYPGTDTVKEEITMSVPAGFHPIDLVPAKTINSSFGTYSLTYSFSKGVLYGKRQFIVRKKIISPSEYKDFKEFYNNINIEDDKNIALKKGK